jgi:hypothetical protein
VERFVICGRGRGELRALVACAVLLSGCGVSRSCGGGEDGEASAASVAANASTALRDEPPGSTADMLFVAPSSYDFSENPPLLERIESGPHGYFRFINIAFSRTVCERFASAYRGVPPVNLHGDAHLEQYAVTDLGRGLTDFDDSSKGPAVLDLLRFGVSLHLTLRMYAPETPCRPYFRRFLEGYRAALEDPEVEAPEPTWVESIRSDFERDRDEYFAWIDEVMKPIPEPEAEALEAALDDYVTAMLRKHPELEAAFFDVEQVGALEMGIGSALDEKYLLRVRGPTDAPNDDVVLEVKEVRSLDGIPCIEGAKGSDPFRILLAQARLAYKPYAYLGYIDFRGRKFWIHSWVDNYQELQRENLARNPEALREVVYDVGVQLGRGHPKIAGEFEMQLRQAQLKALDENEDALLEAVQTLSDATVQAWLRFKRALAED